MSKASSYFLIENLNGKHDAMRLKSQIGALSGVISVSVNKSNARLAVDYDDTGTSSSEIESRLNELGYEVAAQSSEDNAM